MAGTATVRCGLSLALLAAGFLAACALSGSGEPAGSRSAAPEAGRSPSASASAPVSPGEPGGSGETARGNAVPPPGKSAAAVPAPGAVTPPGDSSSAGPPADLYAGEPERMGPVDCGKCHPGPYRDLQASGGKHKFDCQNCHQVIHAYNPVQDNFADLMPKCSQCHVPPHGTKQVNCRSCHNPHAPARTPDLAQVKNACADCHGLEVQQLNASPSKHTSQGCAACHHEQHGYIPSCFECHQPHFPNQTIGECQGCHPVHQPLQIRFTLETKAEICRDCHSGVYGKWANTASRHRQVNCTGCHSRHGEIPQCTACHQSPHPEKQMAAFPRCLDCHLDVHDLPVKRK